MQVFVAFLVGLLVVFPHAEAALRGTQCKLGEWGSWSACSKSCGTGEKTRSRAITTMGSDCPATSESAQCYVPCTGGCTLGPWGPWGLCSETCGGGTERRVRTTNCTGASQQVRPCNTQCCCIDCEVGPWTSWSACSAAGFRKRTRFIVRRPQFGGKSCPEDLAQKEQCHPGPMSCETAQWGAWGACSTTSSCGQHSRTRAIIKSGFDCPPTLQQRKCGQCNTDCVMSEWTAWGACSLSCGGGTRTRTRSVTQPAMNGGTACAGSSQQDSYCNTQPCP
eukprot:TRINITY_DN63452_c0_g2_i1.p1 TRINITY_DN63452_c0_g2~~TRINITY_DN63452_c0_g2_i1.p1  ORF type:complete len:278 (-),score=10.86 TRINITY_DN63452_c0_g2_i1:161-994(-)